MTFVSTRTPAAGRVFAAVMAASALAAAVPQAGFAQADPRIGTWKLNLAKSTFAQGEAPKSRTITYTAATATTVSVDAAGRSINWVTLRNADGRPHPTTGSPNFDASALRRIDAHSFILSRTRAGRLVQVQTNVLSRDGKTIEITSTGIDAAGHSLVSVSVYERQ